MSSLASRSNAELRRLAIRGYPAAPPEPATIGDLPIAPPGAQRVETAEQRERNASRWQRACGAGADFYWGEALVPDGDGWQRCRARETVVEGEARYGRPRWTHAVIRDDGHALVRDRKGTSWRAWRRPLTRGHSPRKGTNARTRGSRRIAASSSQASRAGPSDPDDGEPPGLDTPPAHGARVRLDAATGTVEQVRGDLIEVRWDTGARCPVPIDWVTVLSASDPGTRTPPVAVTECSHCGLALRSRSDARYCSSACRQAAYRERRGELQ